MLRSRITNFSSAASFALKMLECHKTHMTNFSWVQGKTAIGIICSGFFSRVCPLHSEVGLVRKLRPNNDLKPVGDTVDYKIKVYHTTRHPQVAGSIKIATWAQLTENIYLCSSQAHNETISSLSFYFNCLICHPWALHFSVRQRVLIYYQNSVKYLQVK